jgi:peptidyl-prolyl cis-trans isomerase A (cyclophilin A)
MTILKTLFLLLIFNQAIACGKKNLYPDNSYPEVLITTSMGNILVELDRIRAPITVNNFLQYIDSGAYIGTIFHRVEKDFVVQGGGYNNKFEDIIECDKIYNESGNGF